MVRLFPTIGDHGVLADGVDRMELEWRPSAAIMGAFSAINAHHAGLPPFSRLPTTIAATLAETETIRGHQIVG
ncbi:hypothetical protein LCGC14_0510950 [marine sediment metagenome]|uniref:Uncharacterized protein n=1 Tax=marine sediment metagenome TaxID=412755 RepID=A0A0F9V9N2_9ZZZZ